MLPTAFPIPSFTPKLCTSSLTEYQGLPTSLAMSSKPITAECTTVSAMAVPSVPHLLLCPASRRCNSWGNSPSTGIGSALEDPLTLHAQSSLAFLWAPPWPLTLTRISRVTPARSPPEPKRVEENRGL